MSHDPNTTYSDVDPDDAPPIDLDDTPTPEVTRPKVDSATLAEMITLVKTSDYFTNNAEYQKYSRGSSEFIKSGLVDFLFVTGADPHLPTEVFNQLRWGGLVIYMSRKADDVARVFEEYRKLTEFYVERPPSTVVKGLFGLKLPFLSKKVHYFIARKVSLIRPGETTDRFTYHLELTKRDNEWVVLKAVPEHAEVCTRLRGRFPNMAKADIEERARKFTDKVFPIFLTREAAILKILAKNLPEGFNRRIPALYDIVKDDKGYVRKLYMEWLRNSGVPMSQLDFAKQSSELLHKFHDEAAVIHLDLRLDNFVVTERGVGFIDFGSSVRVNERLEDSQLLSQLFEEMMRTSQIQRMLGAMTTSGMVTSKTLCAGLGRVDKAVDVFYLAVQMNKPHANPDFRGLVDFDPNSQQAKLISELTKEILKPRNPNNPTYKSAKDIVDALYQLDARLNNQPAPESPVQV